MSTPQVEERRYARSNQVRLLDAPYSKASEVLTRLIRSSQFTVELGDAICGGNEDRAVSAMLREFHLDGSPLATNEALAEMERRGFRPTTRADFGGSPSPLAQEIRGIVTVPDLSAAKLFALVRKRAGLTNHAPALASWDFMRDERGKRFEVMVWGRLGGCCTSTGMVREYSNEVGFHGNVAAFIAWCMEPPPIGGYVSIPDEDTLLFRDKHRHFFAPCLDRDSTDRGIGLVGTRGTLEGNQNFVAFREVK